MKDFSLRSHGWFLQLTQKSFTWDENIMQSVFQIIIGPHNLSKGAKGVL